MSVMLKMNAPVVLAGLRTKADWVMRSAYQGMVKGMELYQSHIVKNQMSGRKAPNCGLKRPTGTLARSWTTRQLHEGNAGGTVRLGTSTKYAIYHQRGATYTRNTAWGKPTKSYSVTLPKRLYVYEEFETVGRKLIAQQIARAVHDKLESGSMRGQLLGRGR